MRLYIVRHGETQWNTEGRLQGQADIPLNEKGRAIARATAMGTGRGAHQGIVRQGDGADYPGRQKDFSGAG